MRIMALDIATTTGVAIGEAGAIPDSFSVRLKRPSDEVRVAPFNLLSFLRDRWTLERPDLLVIEHFLNPVAQKSADAVILQLMCFGVAVAMAQSYQVRIEVPHASTVRKHFLGRANFGERGETKRQVLLRAKALKYIPADCKDDNRADACALFDFASFTYARVQPKALVMFGAQA